MKPFDGFSQEDLSVLLKLPSVNSKMETFFSGIVNEIRKSLTTLHSDGYSVTVYKGYAELYPGVTIKLDSKGYEFKGWVGLECASQGISFTLWLWAEDIWNQRRSRQAKKLERILNDLGFKLDKSEGYYRSLKNRLHSPEESLNAVKGVALETEKLLASVLSKLQCR